MNKDYLEHRNPAASTAALSNKTQKGSTTEDIMRATYMFASAMIVLATAACGGTGNTNVDGRDAGGDTCTAASCFDEDGDDYCPGTRCAPGLRPRDCDPVDPGTNPGADEICDDGLDNDCDRAVDSADSECDDADGGVEDPCDRDHDDYDSDSDECGGDDCNDRLGRVNPGVTETPRNGVDDDCNPETPDVPGASTDCDDDVDCTIDIRNEGACVHVADDDACDADETCDRQDGCVRVFTPDCDRDADCDDGIGCTDDVCNDDGECDFIPDHDSCESGTCNTRTDCVPPTSHAECEDDGDCERDGIGCTIPVCDRGSCREVATNDFCRTDGSTRVCVPGTGGGCRFDECDDADDCDDGVLCTSDSCASDGRCRHNPSNAVCGSGYLCDPSDADADDDGCLPRGACAPGQTQTCYTGTAGSENLGDCHAGVRQCVLVGRDWTWATTCEGQVTPRTEACDDGHDNDCDEEVDEGCGAPCTLRTWYRDHDDDGWGDRNATQAACERPAGYVEVDSDCDDNNDEINLDADEVCDGVDNDCDRQEDEGCMSGECDPGDARDCFTGPASRREIGACRDGVETCNGDGNWTGTCTGQTLPAGSDLCAPGGGPNGFDDDCDGATDEGCGTTCMNGSTQNCHTSCDPTGGTTGSQTCQPSGIWGACNPPVENCTNGRDDDCDGLSDLSDTAQCVGGCTGGSRLCHTSCDPAGTNTGTETCSGGTWGSCVVPAENCSDGRDNDCDGWSDLSDTAQCGSTCLANEVGRCGDAIDNDCDGRIDSSDTDCGGSVGTCSHTVRIRYDVNFSNVGAWWFERNPGDRVDSGTFSDVFDRTFNNLCAGVTYRWNGDNGTGAGNRFLANYNSTFSPPAYALYGSRWIEVWVDGSSRMIELQYDGLIPGGGSNWLISF